MPDPTAVRILRSLPKAEVHVHLEGCFEAEDLVALAQTAGIRLPHPADRLFAFEDFDAFLHFLEWEGSLVRAAEQLAGAAYRFAARETLPGLATLTASSISPTGRIGAAA